MTPQKPRSTALYRQIIACLEQRRRELGWPFEKLDRVAGLQDRYAAKAWRPDTPSGRVMRWETLQLVLDAMFPDGGFRVFVVPEDIDSEDDGLSPLVRLFLALERAGLSGYEAARVVADAGAELDARGLLASDPEAVRHARAARRGTEALAATQRGQFG